MVSLSVERHKKKSYVFPYYEANQLLLLVAQESFAFASQLGFWAYAPQVKFYLQILLC